MAHDTGDVRRDQSTHGAKISRRAFLGASGSLAVGLPGEAFAQGQPPFFERRSNGAARLTWDGRLWEIDPLWFQSSGSTVRFDSRTQVRLGGRLSGSNLRLDVKIQLKLDGPTWKLVFTENGRDQEISLEQWLSGSPLEKDITLSIVGRPPAASLVVGESLRGKLRYPMRFDLKASSGRDFVYTLNRTNSGTAETLAVMPYDGVSNASGYSNPNLPTEIADLLPRPGVPKMRLELGGVTLAIPSEGWRVGTVGDGSVLRLLPELPRITVEALFRPDASIFAHAWRMGSDAKSSRLVVGDENKPRSLFLAGGAELVEIYGFPHDVYAFIGGLAEVPRMVQGLRYAAFVRGRGRDHVLTGFRSSATISFPITLYTLHARGEDRARYDVDFRRWQKGDAYLDRSSVLTLNPWFGENVDSSDGVEGVLTIGSRPRVAPSPNHLHLGSASGATAYLGEQNATKITNNSPIVRARRHIDGLDVGFLFHDYSLEIRNDGSRLVPGKAAQRGVWFHPQHIQEEVFSASVEQKAGKSFFQLLMTAVSAGKCQDDEPELRFLGSQETYGEPGVFSKLARTRVASPSRIVFRSSNVASPLRLSMSDLTDWKGLAMSVTDRMGEAKKTLDEQILSLGITEQTTRDEARGFVNRQFGPPDPSETAMELVTGLVFSPDDKARLRISADPSGEDAGLWTAQLDLLPADPAKDASSEVRAIWAAGLESGNLISPKSTGKPLALEAPFRTSINARQKAEVVLMSSGRGIAAVRALSKTGQDVPASLVRRPKATFDYIDNEARPKDKNKTGPSFHQEGVISPVPFARFDARFTPYGADLDAQWKGEPAGNWPNWKKKTDDPFFNTSFSVEEYVHRTSLGSDMLVKVLEKGFMFPYGFRVILLRISQREPQLVEDMGAMAPMIQRYYIVPKPVMKSLPGIYQPYNGYEIPVRHARLIFERSPEIDSCMEMPPELSSLADRIVGSVFWPLFQGTDTEIEFDFEADDTGTRRSVPMLFLNNAAVHDAQTVRAVIHYYNEIAPERLRSEAHHGGRTIYATAEKAGDTTFETDRIILKARSRIVETNEQAGKLTAETPDLDLVQYQMDAFMEGADEPPFYPMMHEAFIKVPPLDRLLGSPQGMKRVGYNSLYVQKGFSAENPSKLFLNFLDPKGVMQLAGRGEISGGVSQTPTNLSGISRDNAIVGAPDKDPDAPERKRTKEDARRALLATADVQRLSAMPPPGTNDRTPWNLDDAEAGNFNPLGYFKFPRLFGCVEIDKAVMPAPISSQPKLKEVYNYTLGEANGAEKDIVEAFADVAKTAAAAITSALDKAEEALCKFLNDEMPEPGRVPSKEYKNLADFYPELTRGLTALRNHLEALGEAKVIADILAGANAVMEAWRQLRGAVDAVIANPSPEPVRDIITKLRTALDGAENLIRGALRGQIASVLDAFVADLIVPLRDAILDEVFNSAGGLVNIWIYEAFLGPVPSDVTLPITREALARKIDEIIKGQMQDKPVPVAGLDAAPLGRSITRPILDAVSAIYRLRKQSGDLEAMLLNQMADAAVSALQVLLDAIASVQSLVDAAVGAIDRACTIADGPLSKMVGLVLSGLPSTTDFRNRLANLNTQWSVLLLSKLGATPEAERVRAAANALRVQMNRLADQVDPIDMLRTALPQDDNGKLDWCRSIGRIPTTIAGIQRRRGLAADALKGCASGANAVQKALMDLAEADRVDAVAALKTMVGDFATLCLDLTLSRLADTADRTQSQLAARLQPLGNVVVARLDQAEAELYPVARDLVQKVTDPNLSAELLEGVAQTAVKVALFEEKLLSLATDYTVLSDKLLERARAIAAGVAKDVAAPLIAVHQAVFDGASAAINLIESAPDFIILLTGSLLSRLKIAQAAVQLDLNALKNISQDPGNAVVLIDRWKKERPALANAAQTVLEIFDSVARGQIGALFDLAGARRAIEEAVRRLIPSHITLTYDWTANLQPYPEDDPFFLPDPTADDDLIISTRIDIDVLNPKDRSVNVKGTLKPFKLHLLAGVADLATIEFTDTEFTSDGHGSPNFKTKIGQVVIGDDLMFLQELQEWMTGGGFTILPVIDPPGVEIGYSIGEPVIEMGAVTLLNTALSISANLPFTDKEAVFKFAFASSERPFGIIVKPYYYGGGFVSIMTTAKTGSVDLQLEFGAAAAITFGPLKGWGLISAGINLHTGSNNALKGFVHALGEGQLGCFGMSVNIEVAVEQQGDAMTGSSTYRYSFKVGFIHVDFEFEARYEVAGGKKKDKGFAPLSLGISEAPDPLPYELKYKDKHEDWVAYRDHFVEEWA
jgi:hypothetical protein